MPTTLRFRRYSNTSLSTITGADGELIIDETNKTLTVHDGSTAGGSRLATEAFALSHGGSNVASILPSYTGNVGASNILLTNHAGLHTQSSTESTFTANLQNDVTGFYVEDSGSAAVYAATNIVIETNSAGSNGSNNWIFNIDGSLQFPDSTRQLTGFKGYATDNTARTLAQAAYNAANADLTLLSNELTSNDQFIATINASQNTLISSAYSTANAAVANTVTLFGIEATQNTNITNATNLAQAAFNYANSIPIIDSVARTTANSAQANTIVIQGVDVSQNSNIALLQGAMTSANANIAAALAQANAAFVQANIAATIIPQNPQSSNYVLVSSDAGKHLYYTNGSAVSLYIPWTANTTFANGTSIIIVSHTSSNVTVTPNVGVTMYLAGNTTSASRNVTTYGMATLLMTAANTWYINGTGVY